MDEGIGRHLRTVAAVGAIDVRNRDDDDRLAGTARQDKVDFNVAYIGSDFGYPHPGQFDREYMKELFAYGYRLGEKGDPWRKRLPDEPELSPNTRAPR